MEHLGKSILTLIIPPPEKFLKELIKQFNDDLRNNEKARILIKWEPTDKNKDLRHEWQKTSLITETGGYDRMRCCRCGATGKRYGVGQNGTVPDSKKIHRQNCCPKS